MGRKKADVTNFSKKEKKKAPRKKDIELKANVHRKLPRKASGKTPIATKSKLRNSHITVIKGRGKAINPPTIIRVKLRYSTGQTEELPIVLPENLPQIVNTLKDEDKEIIFNFKQTCDLAIVQEHSQGLPSDLDDFFDPKMKSTCNNKPENSVTVSPGENSKNNEVNKNLLAQSICKKGISEKKKNRNIPLSDLVQNEKTSNVEMFNYLKLNEISKETKKKRVKKKCDKNTILNQNAVPKSGNVVIKKFRDKLNEFDNFIDTFEISHLENNKSREYFSEINSEKCIDDLNMLKDSIIKIKEIIKSHSGCDLSNKLFQIAKTDELQSRQLEIKEQENKKNGTGDSMLARRSLSMDSENEDCLVLDIESENDSICSKSDRSNIHHSEGEISSENENINSFLKPSNNSENVTPCKTQAKITDTGSTNNRIIEKTNQALQTDNISKCEKQRADSTNFGLDVGKPSTNPIGVVMENNGISNHLENLNDYSSTMKSRTYYPPVQNNTESWLQYEESRNNHNEQLHILKSDIRQNIIFGDRCLDFLLYGCKISNCSQSHKPLLYEDVQYRLIQQNVGKEAAVHAYIVLKKYVKLCDQYLQAFIDAFSIMYTEALVEVAFDCYFNKITSDPNHFIIQCLKVFNTDEWQPQSLSLLEYQFKDGRYFCNILLELSLQSHPNVLLDKTTFKLIKFQCDNLRKIETNVAIALLHKIKYFDAYLTKEILDLVLNNVQSDFFTNVPQELLQFCRNRLIDTEETDYFHTFNDLLLRNGRCDLSVSSTMHKFSHQDISFRDKSFIEPQQSDKKPCDTETTSDNRNGDLASPDTTHCEYQGPRCVVDGFNRNIQPTSNAPLLPLPNYTFGNERLLIPHEMKIRPRQVRGQNYHRFGTFLPRNNNSFQSQRIFRPRTFRPRPFTPLNRHQTPRMYQANHWSNQRS